MRVRLALIAAVAACAHGPPAGALRFHDRLPVWCVNDRTPLAAMPAERRYHRTLYHADGFLFRRTARALELRRDVRARDVNALDEVPDSTWFTNRIGVRALSLEEVRRGPDLGPSPFDHRPWTLVGAKPGGGELGFTFEDARGDRYILKFDSPRSPELETGAHVIVHRILWAIGYNVPDDHVGYVRARDLVPGAGVDAGELARTLARVYRTDDGRIRVLASRLLPGTPIGPYAREGTRADDPNDLIPHEQRRSLRGQYPIFAWLNHTDLQEDNTLDVFTDGRYVVHYLIDFGMALGVMGYQLRWQTVGHTYRFDLGVALANLVTLGLRERPWDGLHAPDIRGIGVFDAAHYDPGGWRPNSPYWPLEDKDRFDAFWGAKLVMRFTRAQLAAIVGEARYSDPRAAAYMVDTLVARQRATARYWFDRVAPLDVFAVSHDDGGARLCFTDLLLAYELARPRTRYRFEVFDGDGRRIGASRRFGPTPSGRTCAHGIPLAGSYTIVRLHVVRDRRVLPPVDVHLARDERGIRLIGLRRR